jgi:formylglycine-generating enzyme required for sulfatase activity
MLGNMSEWTSSLFKPYPYDVADGRENDGDSKTARVIRGGSFLNGGMTVNNETRLAPYLEYTGTNLDIGFRCAYS